MREVIDPLTSAFLFFFFAMHTALFSKAPRVRLHAACRNYLSVSTKGNADKVKLTLYCMVLQQALDARHLSTRHAAEKFQTDYRSIRIVEYQR